MQEAPGKGKHLAPSMLLRRSICDSSERQAGDAKNVNGPLAECQGVSLPHFRWPRLLTASMLLFQ